MGKDGIFQIEGDVLLLYTGPGGAVEIPEGVREIREEAFTRCRAITVLQFPESLRVLRARFKGWRKLCEVRFPDALEELPDQVCRDCTSLEKVRLPARLRAVPESAFRGCSALCRVDIPRGVTAVEDLAFEGCSSLKKVSLSPGLRRIGREAFRDCTALRTVTLPEGLEQVEDYAFTGCTSLTGVHLPDTPFDLLDGVFCTCRALKNVRFTGGLRSIGDLCFAYTALKDADFADGLEQIGKDAFRDTSLEHVTFSPAMDCLDMGIFRGATVRFLAWTAGVPGDPWKGRITAPKGFDFSGITLDAPRMDLAAACPESKEALCLGFAFRCRNHLPLHPKLRKDYLFYLNRRRSSLWKNPQLLEVILNEELAPEEQAAHWLEEAEALNRQDLAALLQAYHGGVKKPKTPTRIPRWKWKQEPGGGVRILAWQGTSGTNVMVPAEIRGKRTVAVGMKAFSPEAIGLTKEQREARRQLEEVFLPDAVRTVAGGAFQGCTGLKTVHLPGSLDAVEPECFASCENLQEIDIPYGADRIGAGAFRYCAGLRRVYLPDTIEAIGENAFLGCESLRSVQLPQSLLSLGKNSFAFSGLREVTVPGRVKKIQGGTFAGCRSLKRASLEAGVCEVEDLAFTGCGALRDVTLPASLRQLGKYALPDTDVLFGK